MEAVLATAADEVVGFIQRFLVQVTGAVTGFRHNQHIILQRHKDTSCETQQRRTEEDGGTVSSKTHQPQRLAARYLNCEEDLVVCHVQNDLILRHQDVAAAVSVGTEGGVGVT